MSPLADVARVDFANCVLLGGDGTLTSATVRGRLMGRRKSLGNALVVGDRARFEDEAGRAAVEEVLPRRNAFARRAPGNQPAEQVVAANLDQIIVVASVVQPEFRHGLVDRVLAQADRCGLHARLVMTKSDLAGDAEAHALLEDYRAAGIATHVVSVPGALGLEPLRHECHGRRSLFVGHSGVGKSTLLNALVPGLDLLAGAVNEKTLKGRHTTTAAWMVRPESGFELIDTPGIRAFGLWGVPSNELDRHYAELRGLQGTCRFLDCSHESEPGCAVRDAVGQGAISPRRYDSFVKLRAELRDEEIGVERVRATTRWRR